MSYNGTIIREVKEKWEHVLNDDIDYKTIERALYDIPKLKESAYQKYLQFEILHSRTAVHEKLFRMKIVE